MPTKEDVDKFYEENYYNLLRYLINKKRGGNKTGLRYDFAMEVLHDCYIYHAKNPHNLNPKYIWNMLNLKRISFIRNQATYNSMKDNFFEAYYEEGGTHIHEIEDSTSRNQLAFLIKEEISSLLNKKHKQILTAYFIRDESIDRKDWSSLAIVKRFKNKMIEKYGGHSDVDG